MAEAGRSRNAAAALRPRSAVPRVRRLCPIFGVLALLALPGCGLDVGRPDAAPEIPARYRAAPSNPHAAMPVFEWWRGFRSQELNDLVIAALAQNYDVGAAIARIIQADAQARIVGAPLLPSIGSDASASRSHSSGATSSGGGSGFDRSLLHVGFNASYEIDFWGKNRALLAAAQELAIASRFDADTVTITTIASVLNNYFQLLAAQDRVRIANDNVASATRILQVIQDRVNVGTATALDLAQQEAVLAALRATIPLLEQIVLQNKNTLGLLVGRAPEQVKIRGGSMARIVMPRVTPGLPSELLLQRPDIRSAEAQLAAADASVVAARAAFFPTIQLTGEGGFESLALRTLFTGPAAFYTVAASVTQPIFDGGRLLGQFQLQKGRQIELLQLYQKAVIAGFTDVENALTAIQLLARRERLQREAVAFAQRAYQLSETRLREGTVDLVVVLNTQQTLFNAQDLLAQIQLARLMAVVGLFQALGGGWSPPGGGMARAQ